MKTFWSDTDGFSIKDFYGLVFSFLFIVLNIVALLSKDKATPISLLQTLSPIVLTIIGGYAVSEGAKGVMNYFQSSNADNSSNDDQSDKSI